VQVCDIRTFVVSQKLGPTYGYVSCEPSCNRTYPARVATFRCFVPQLERTTRVAGRVPCGGLIAPPALSLRAKGAKDQAPPPCTGETRGESSSPPDVVIVADEGTPTRVSRLTDRFSCSLSLHFRDPRSGPGFRSGPTYPGLGP